MNVLFVASSLLQVTVTAPEHVRVTACGPLDTTLCVVWNDPTGGGNQVQYGFDQSLGKSVVAEASSAPDPLGTVFRARLDTLAPYSDYLYRVGGPGTGYSDTLTLHTGPKTGDPCLPVSVVVLGNSKSEGDAGASANWSAVLSEALAVPADVILHTGHVVKNGASAAQWANLFDQTGAGLTKTPMIVAPSDLDKAGGTDSLFNVAFAGGPSPAEPPVFLTVGDVGIAVLDTEVDAAGIEAQATWLDQTLTAQPTRWKIVVLHRPPYAAFSDKGLVPVGARPNEVGQNPWLVPVFDAHHVDLVFAGRTNFYERFAPMRYDSAHPEQGDPVDGGTTYVVTGGAGSLTLAPFKIGGTALDPLADICGLAAGSEVCVGLQHFVRLKVDRNTLTLEAWATSTQNNSSGPENIALIDSLTLDKTDPIQCAGDPWPDGVVEVVTGPDAGQAELEPADASPVDAALSDAGPIEDAATTDVGPEGDATPTKPDFGASAEPMDYPDAGGTVSDVAFGVAEDVTPTAAASGDGGCAAGLAGPASVDGTLTWLGAMVAALAMRRRHWSPTIRV